MIGKSSGIKANTVPVIFVNQYGVRFSARVKEDMRPEYNYGKAKPNRFANKLDESRVVVVLDPDVSRIFQTPDSVNKALRALIEAMPPSGAQKGFRINGHAWVWEHRCFPLE